MIDEAYFSGVVVAAVSCAGLAGALVLLGVREAGEVKWRAKPDRDGDPLKECWLSDDGYTVALCRLPAKRYTVTRPGGALPFAYTGERDDVPRLIEADIKASAGKVVGAQVSQGAGR